MKKKPYLEEKLGITAAPISKKVSEAIEKGTINLDSEEDLDEFIKGLQDFQENKFNRAASLNLLNINNGKNTIEFRVANGTLDPNVWIQNIKLFGRIVQTSEKLAQMEKKIPEELSENDKNLISLMDDLKKEKPENEKMEILLQLLFTEEERNVYRERYNENCKLLEEESEKENNPLKGLEFAESVDFRKKRHTKEEYFDIAKENRRGNYQVVTSETREGVTGENTRMENTKEREEK